MKPILIATSNPGKLRDFTAAAGQYGIGVTALPGFDRLPSVSEDGASFEVNARKKAEFYALHAPGELVLADDSGLEVAALDGAPGIRSARYAADQFSRLPLIQEPTRSIDRANNDRLLCELKDVSDSQRWGRFVCVLAAAKDGTTRAVFRGEVEGLILSEPRGERGFGYDPLFYLPHLGKTMAEISPEEKAAASHRGQAFREFLEWYRKQ